MAEWSGCPSDITSGSRGLQPQYARHMTAGSVDGTPVVEGFTDLVEIGRGGFSVVYAATQAAVQRRVALKVLNATGGEARRLEREAAALGALSDIPNIVEIYHVTSTTDGRPVIVMKLMTSAIPCGTGPGEAEVERTLAWLGQVSTALDEAHRRNIFHRDLKPQNILIAADGSAHLVDFGIAGLDGLDAGTTTAFSFSPPFAPPERLTGAEVDPRAGDVYGLAATFFAVMTGRPPFGSSDTGGVHGLITRVVTEPLAQPDWMNTDCYAAFSVAMSKEPNDRFSSAGAFAAAVAASLSQASTDSPTPFGGPLPVVGAAVDEPTSVRPAGASTTPGTPAAATPPSARPSSNRARWSAAAIAVILLLGSVGYFIARGGSEAASTATTTTDTAPSTTDSSSSTTAELQPETLTACSITGTATLQPGVLFGQESSQTVTLPADLDCSTDQGPIQGSATFTVEFPVLGANGGTGNGTGSIAWTDGRSTELVVAAEVFGIPEYQLVLQLAAMSGVGEGETGVAYTALTVDVGPGEVLNTIGIAGDVDWSGPAEEETTTTLPPPAG